MLWTNFNNFHSSRPWIWVKSTYSMLGKDILERLYLVGHIFILFVASRKTVSYCLSGRLSFAPKSYIYCSVNTTNNRCALQSNTSVMFEDFSIHFWLQWGANYRAAEGIFPRFFFIIHDTVRDRLLCKWIFVVSKK